jgi:hypothetical protein
MLEKVLDYDFDKPWSRIGNHIFLFTIVFCGKVYRGIQYYDPTETKRVNGVLKYVPAKREFYYSFEDFYKAMKDIDNLGIFKEKRSWLEPFNYEKYFEDTGPTTDWLMDYHHDIGVPFVKISNKNIVYNPRLMDYHFYREVDAVSAFQEISMFISGVLGGQSPKLVQLSDKDLIAKRGFDKWSFRKMGEVK